MSYLLDVFVEHEPEQAGSKNAFVVYRDRARKRPMRRAGGKVTCAACGETDGSIIVTVSDENAKLKKFQGAVAAAVTREWRKVTTPELLAQLDESKVGFVLLMDFYLPRPQGHYGTGRNAHLVKDDAPARPVTYPDEDKLLRGAQDGMASVVWRNDSQVVCAVAQKWYAVPTAGSSGAGVRIRIRLADEQRAADLPIEARARVVPGADEAPAGDEAQGSLLVA